METLLMSTSMSSCGRRNGKGTTTSCCSLLLHTLTGAMYSFGHEVLLTNTLSTSLQLLFFAPGTAPILRKFRK